ncbi:hypothetical protein [Streptomyces sp. SAI-097]
MAIATQIGRAPICVLAYVIVVDKVIKLASLEPILPHLVKVPIVST